MNIQERHKFSDEDKVIQMEYFSPYCAKCDLLIPIGHSARKYDGATFYHINCPNRPLRRYALKRLARPGTYKYPMLVNM
jgi:hypothetical protein